MDGVLAVYIELSKMKQALDWPKMNTARRERLDEAICNIQSIRSLLNFDIFELSVYNDSNTNNQE